MARPSLLGQAALGRFDEAYQLCDVRRAVERLAHLFERLSGIQLGAQQQAIGALDGLDAFRAKPWRSRPIALTP